ncbi:GRB2-associated-binding protein 1-like isoform X2 [Mugil cephalus]|uniref:GRB2-associated-binding protein 1-like isoform X2 n=1 Tax=Mugil cephalus TaxID=48193 RepID=UPI001FB84575|nr:GRB2-associated-binding protein 1-like isoform X2 [Mugil cephalus]
MNDTGDMVCEGWLRKSPPEKKLRRYAWKKRWFVLRSGRLTGEPDVLQYYKNQQSRNPIRTINMNLCEQVDAGMSFTKRGLESSFVFDLKTVERTWYLVAESEEDMNRWVSSICLLCGFNPTDDVPERPLISISTTTSNISISGSAPTSRVTGTAPLSYDPVTVRHMEPDCNAEDDYLWLSHCQSHIRPSLGFSTSLEANYNDHPYPPISTTSSFSSSSSSPSLIHDSLPPPSSPPSFRAAWTLATMTSPLSQSLDASMTSDLLKRVSQPHCHPSPHPRKHSLDFQLRPLAIPFSDYEPSNVHSSAHSYTNSGYQIPRPASTPQPPHPSHLSSTPSTDSVVQVELHTFTASPPPRPPKPTVITAPIESSSMSSGSATLPRITSDSKRREYVDGEGYLLRSNADTIPGRMQTCYDSFYIPRSRSDRASMFEFSDSFNSYFFNKGMVPLGSVCSEDDDVDENYVPMSAATTEPPVALKVPQPPPCDASTQLQDGNYVPMTLLIPSVPTHTNPATGDLGSLGMHVPPPAHMGFRNSPLNPVAPHTPPQRRHTIISGGGGEVEAMPPPIHRNLKPQRRGISVNQTCMERKDGHTVGEQIHKTRVKPAPLDITPLLQDWQEVPPPVRSPVTRTFTRDPSSRPCFRPSSAHSSSPSSDSDDPNDSYVAMTTSSLSFSAGEPSLRLMLQQTSEGGVDSPLQRRSRSNKQVEYLDLDLHTGRSTPTRQRCCIAEGGTGGNEQDSSGKEHARGRRTRVDYVVVDPEKTKALRNTREAWHDGRMSTDKEKS